MRNLAILVLLILAGLIFSNLLSLSIWFVGGLDINTFLEGEDLPYGKRQLLRLGLMINHMGMFLLPGILYCLYVIKDNIYDRLRLDQLGKLSHVGLWGAIMLLSYPVLMKITEWNSAFPLPEWMRSSQESNFALLEQTLNMTHISELVTSLLLVGALAAIGEELIFRGIIQRQLEQLWSNPHLAILVSSLIFGGFHMQFERILPLSFLGLILGYSYYYTQSLWTPIILHFANNGLQVIAYYIAIKHGDIPEIDNIPSLPLSIVLASLLLTAVIAYIAIRAAQPTYESRS